MKYIWRINRNSDSARIAAHGKEELLGELPDTYEAFLELTGINRQQSLHDFFKGYWPMFTPKYMRHSPTFAIGETLEEARNREAAIRQENKEREEAQEQKRLAWEAEARNEMSQPCKGWYVVTLDVLVSKIRGNDGNKTYSFRVLAESQMDAFHKACHMAETELKDANVDFVYGVNDTATSALIEYVGVWTDAAVEEFGLDK